jgi:hypothetical protein
MQGINSVTDINLFKTKYLDNHNAIVLNERTNNGKERLQNGPGFVFQKKNGSEALVSIRFMPCKCAAYDNFRQPFWIVFVLFDALIILLIC